MKSALPRHILLPPAELALKSLQAWCFGSEIFGSMSLRQSLDSESRELLDICQGLRIKGYSSEGVLLLSQNSLLNKYTERISNRLCENVILELALLTWHFDATSELPSKELLNFFAHPDDKVEGVCQAICERYNTLIGASVSCCEFGERFANHLGYLESGIAKGWY